MELKIEYVDINSISPYENNAKLHTAEQIEQIKNSIQQFEMIDPIGVWKNQVVEGHGRLIACKELGFKEIPIMRLDSLTDEQRRAYMLVHNKLTMNTGFDVDLLSMELDDISNIDMGLYGFDLNSIEIEDIDSEYLNPEEPIAKELDEANNYIVLEFNTETDWEEAKILFDLKKVQTADENEKIRRHGIGRVIDGKEVMERIKGEN